jgi:hypothetical protein
MLGFVSFRINALYIIFVLSIYVTIYLFIFVLTIWQCSCASDSLP